MESSSTGAKKINHKKQEKYSSGHFQTHLALALDGGPELAELGEVDALIPVLDPEVNILKIFWKEITRR